MSKFRWPEKFQPIGFTVSLIACIVIVIFEFSQMLPLQSFVTIVLDAIFGCSFWYCIGMTGALKRFNRRK